MPDGLSSMPAYLLNRLRTRNTFTQQVASTFTMRALILVCGLGTGVITARWLGPTGKGLYQLGLLLPAMLGLFLSAGINSANVYYAGAQRLSAATLMAHSLSLAMLASTLGGMVVVLLVLTGWIEVLVPGLPMWLVAGSMLCLPLSLLLASFNAILQGLQRLLLVNSIMLLQSVVLCGLTALLVIGCDMGLPGALVAYITALGCGLSVASVILRRAGGALRPRWDRAVVRSMFAYGMRGYLGNVLQFYTYRLDNFLLNYYLGAGSVGIYSVAVRCAELLWRFPDAVGFVIFPRAATTKARDMNRLTPRVFTMTLGLTVTGAVGLILVARPLIRLLYSADFLGAYGPLLALLPGVTLLGAAKVLTNDMAGRGYPQYNALSAGIALGCTIVLALALIPRWGVLGAAIASSIAYAVTFGASMLFYVRVRRAAE